MKPFRARLETRFLPLVAVALAASLAGCEDDTTTARRYIPLTQPLSLQWQGGIARISAAAELRVDWTVLIESVPVGATPAARHRRTFNDQTLVLFSWDGHNNVGEIDFVRGDSCVVSVSYPQIDPAESAAKLGFRLP